MKDRVGALKPLQSTHTISQAAKKLGITRHNVEHVVRYHGLKFTNEPNTRGAKLVAGDIPIIRELAEFLKVVEIAVKFEVTPQTIHNILSGRTWQCVK
tara:strand:+ start:20679 stop:20972 length:294 start_codon:yes stop_codon:yes gene_type:complete